MYFLPIQKDKKACFTFQIEKSKGYRGKALIRSFGSEWGRERENLLIEKKGSLFL